MQNRSRSRSSSNDRERGNEVPCEPSKRLFVAGVTPNATKDDLEGLFRECGSVVDMLMKPLENGGILCFVEMATQGEADAAISALNGKRICGKMLWVKYARPRQHQQGGRREGGGGRQGDRQERGQPFGQRGGRSDFGQRSEVFKRFEAGRGNERSNERRGENRGRFGQERQGDGGNNQRCGFRNFERRDEEPRARMFGGNGQNQGGDCNRGGREQAARPLSVVEEHDY